jgi:hypothetical protein
MSMACVEEPYFLGLDPRSRWKGSTLVIGTENGMVPYKGKAERSPES